MALRPFPLHEMISGRNFKLQTRFQRHNSQLHLNSIQFNSIRLRVFFFFPVASSFFLLPSFFKLYTQTHTHTHCFVWRGIEVFLIFCLLHFCSVFTGHKSNKNKTQANAPRTKTKMKTCTKFAILIKWYENCKSHEKEKKQKSTNKKMKNRKGSK